VRGIAALLVLAVAMVGVLVWALPRLAESDRVKARIQQVAREATGGELEYEAIDFGLFPPSLQVANARVAAKDADEPLARADNLSLWVEFWPLLRRELQVSSLHLEGLVLHLVRTPEGFALPTPTREERPGDAPAPEAEPTPEPEEEEGGIAFGMRRIAVRDGTFVIEDRRTRPAETWRVEDVDITARAVDPGAPVGLEGSFGSASGPTLAVDGGLAFEAEIDDLLGDATGPFEIDATDADIHYGSELRKPAGTRAQVRGQLVRDDAGALAVDALEIDLHDLRARGELRTAPKTKLVLQADPVELKGWREILPSLALTPLEGKLAIPELALTTDPLDLRGRLGLVGVVLSLPEREPVSFDGSVVLLGSRLETRDMVLTTAGQPISVDAKLTQLFGARRFDLTFETKGVDADALLGALAGQRGKLEGPLDAKGTLRGPLGGGAPLLESIAGDLRFEIPKGRIVGSSLLEVVLGGLGGQLAQLGRAQASPEFERFYNETFDLLAGSLHVEDGRLLSQPLTLKYADYTAQLEGPIALTDMGLDLKGSLTFYETVDRALARRLGAPSSYEPQRRTIQLASVRGTLGKPKVQLSSNAVAGLVTAYAGAVGREELRKRLEEQLGTGSGEIVDQGLRALEGLFGGGAKGPAAPEEAPAPASEGEAAPAEKAPAPAAEGEPAPAPADPPATGDAGVK
jgi:hypothetical protein